MCKPFEIRCKDFMKDLEEEAKQSRRTFDQILREESVVPKGEGHITWRQHNIDFKVDVPKLAPKWSKKW